MDVNKLNEKIKKMQKEVEDIQEKCIHKMKEIKMNETGSPKWTCKKCEKRLSFPTENELKNFFDK
tara:strand:- start:1051 stop:1245 length:195 start_codon:yes stop_codon:yes gene_type:complete